MPERVSLPAVIAMALLKAYVEQRPVTVNDISRLLMDPVITPLLADSLFGLRRVGGGKVYSEDVDEFVSRWLAAGYARWGEEGSIELLSNGRRLCFHILCDEAKSDPAGINALAAVEALELGVSDFLRCIEEEWLQPR